jgi:hypothetical protein
MQARCNRQGAREHRHENGLCQDPPPGTSPLGAPSRCPPRFQPSSARPLPAGRLRRRAPLLTP